MNKKIEFELREVDAEEASKAFNSGKYVLAKVSLESPAPQLNAPVYMAVGYFGGDSVNIEKYDFTVSYEDVIGFFVLESF